MLACVLEATNAKLVLLALTLRLTRQIACNAALAVILERQLHLAPSALKTRLPDMQAPSSASTALRALIPWQEPAIALLAPQVNHQRQAPAAPHANSDRPQVVASGPAPIVLPTPMPPRRDQHFALPALQDKNLVPVKAPAPIAPKAQLQFQEEAASCALLESMLRMDHPDASSVPRTHGPRWAHRLARPALMEAILVSAHPVAAPVLQAKLPVLSRPASCVLQGSMPAKGPMTALCVMPTATLPTQGQHHALLAQQGVSLLQAQEFARRSNTWALCGQLWSHKTAIRLADPLARPAAPRRCRRC